MATVTAPSAGGGGEFELPALLDWLGRPATADSPAPPNMGLAVAPDDPTETPPAANIEPPPDVTLATVPADPPAGIPALSPLTWFVVPLDRQPTQLGWQYIQRTSSQLPAKLSR